MSDFDKKKIEELLHLLNTELAKENIEGELFLVGGAVMALVYDSRRSTKDLDAYFQPAQEMRKAACRVQQQMDIDEDWLNDAVKGFFSDQADFQNYLELSHLRVSVATPEYLLAMKCLAMRIGEEFQDIADVQYLLRYLNISTYEKAVEVIAQYYPLERFPQKTLYALEELLS